MIRLLPQTIALCALVLSSSSASLAQETNASSNPAPTHVTNVGTLRVEQYGAGSPAMVFIPGLSCGSWVWDEAVKTYAAKHAVYVVTLAGFDGVPPPAAPATPSIDAADASLLQLIATQKLDRPIVVGHSLGGYLALRFGTEHAALVRGIVTIDGLPILPPFLAMTPEQRATTAQKIEAQLQSSTPEQFAAGQKQTLATMITSPADVDRVAALSAKSDPKAVGAYAGDLFKSDLRPELAKLTVPTLVIAPVPTVPAAYEGPAKPMAERQAGYKEFYTSLFPGAPNVTVVTVPNSKHFVMIDQPAALYDAITAFVGTLKA